MDGQAAEYIAGLGGVANIYEVVPVYTRIRVEVASLAFVDDAALRRAGAYGVVRQKNYVHLIVGKHASELARAMAELIFADR